MSEDAAASNENGTAPDAAPAAGRAELLKELASFEERRLSEEHDRYRQLTRQATSLLSALTVLIGFAGSFGAWTLEGFVPPSSPSDYAFFGLSALAVASVFAAWASLFRALQMRSLDALVADRGLVEWALGGSVADLHHHIAHRSAEAFETAIAANAHKAGLVRAGYKFAFAAVGLLIAAGGAYVWHLWTAL